MTERLRDIDGTGPRVYDEASPSPGRTKTRRAKDRGSKATALPAMVVVRREAGLFSTHVFRVRIERSVLRARRRGPIAPIPQAKWGWGGPS